MEKKKERKAIPQSISHSTTAEVGETGNLKKQICIP